MAINKVKDDTDLRGLIELVRNPQRVKPVCIFTTPISSPDPSFNLEDLEKEVGDFALFYLVPTGDLTRRFVNELEPKAAVFNGAAKVFAPSWQEEDEWPKLFYCHPKFQVRDTQSLIDEIWKLASDKDIQSYANYRSVPMAATLEKIFGTRAFVKTSTGLRGTVREEITCPGIPLAWILPEEARMEGQYNEAEKLFMPKLSQTSLVSIVEAYGFGNLVPVLIKEAERKKGVATIFPGIDIPFILEEISGNERDLVTDFLGPGQVVAMRLYRDPQGRTRLRMNDIDDDEESVESLSVILGGPSWLIVDRDIPILEVTAPVQVEVPELSEFEAPVEQEVVVSTSPTPKPGNYKSQPGPASPIVTGRDHHKWVAYATDLTRRLNSALDEAKSLRAEVVSHFNEKNALKRRIDEMGRSNASARRKIASKDPNKSSTRSRRDRWASNEDWFNEEIRRVWISRYKPAEREDTYPLDFKKFSYGPMFFESVLNPDLTEDELRKAVRVIVDVVTGRESEARQNRVHPLRETESPSSPQRSRPDGSKAWRANIEDKTPQAKRLHYWKTTTGHIELSRVAQHDDFSA
jgi:hypothetical protein